MKSIKLKITSGFSDKESEQVTLLTSECNFSESHVRQVALKKSMVKLLTEIAELEVIEWLEGRIQDFLNTKESDSFVFLNDGERCLNCYLSV